MTPYPDEFGIGQARCAAHAAAIQRAEMERLGRLAYGPGYVPPPVRTVARRVWPAVAAEYARARIIQAYEARQ